MTDLHVVVLAAGKGTRMKSSVPKVLHRVAGSPMIEHVLATAAQLQPRSTVVVVGHQAEAVQAALASHSDLTFVVQEPQLGTAHALLTAEPAFAGAKGHVILLSGDVPLLSVETLKALASHHDNSSAAITVVTAIVDRPEGYGRIVRDDHGMSRIVEHRDASPVERDIREINAGIYALALDGLFDTVRSIATNNAQGEYYLPDLVGLFRGRGRGTETLTVSDPAEIHGINSRAELATASRRVRLRKADELMATGVTIEDPATTYIDHGVTVGMDTIIRPGVTLEGHTAVGEACVIHSGVRIANSRIGDRVTVFDHSVVTDSTVAHDAQLGPFARLRNHADVRPRARVGNFVELKNTTLGTGSKSMHLAYLGDATVGEKVNVGAGVITCNYDGTRKNRTVIEDGAFVGSDSQLIAPVTIHAGAYVGSGTTVRENVPSGSLAVSAGRQRNIEGWADKKKERRGER